MLIDGDYTARLVDFGFTSAVGKLPEALAYLQRNSSGPGALRWAAPEHFLVENIERTIKSDIYSLGNLTFMASPPFVPRISILILSRHCRENLRGRKYIRIMR